MESGPPILKALLVYQLTAARVVCGFGSWRWSKGRLLKRVGWLSVRQLVYFHTVLQAHKTLSSGLPGPLYDELTCVNPYQTRSASQGHIAGG